MVFQCVNRGRWRCRELQVSILNRSHWAGVSGYCFQRLGAYGQAQSTGDWTNLATWAYPLEQHNAFFMYCDRSLPPPFATRKEYHTHPGPVASHGATPRAFFPRIFPHDVPRTEREFTRVQTGPGLPRDQFSRPWLFSTVEARTINSSSSSALAIGLCHQRRGGHPRQ